MKIGIFGGTFDPIHIGHIISVFEVKISFGLDKVIFIPARQSPHKETMPTGNTERLDMIHKAIARFECFSLDTFELNRDGKSFTYDTAKYLRDKYPHDELYFLMGTDQYETFDKWYKHDELISMMNFIVMMRHSDDMEISAPFIRADQLVVEVSSTLVRKRIKEGLPYKHFLNEDVYEYIKENALYEA